VGEILLSASGTFSADSGRSIFLEQHVEQRGARKYFRWEIPYPYIYRIEAGAPAVQAGGPTEERQTDTARRAAAAAAGECSGGPSSSVISFPRRPKTA